MTPLSATVVTESTRGIEPPDEIWRTRVRALLRTLCDLDEETTWPLTKPHCCTFRYAHHAHPDRRLQEVLG
jgi:hypothetical protein